MSLLMLFLFPVEYKQSSSLNYQLLFGYGVIGSSKQAQLKQFYRNRSNNINNNDDDSDNGNRSDDINIYADITINNGNDDNQILI